VSSSSDRTLILPPVIEVASAPPRHGRRALSTLHVAWWLFGGVVS